MEQDGLENKLKELLAEFGPSSDQQCVKLSQLAQKAKENNQKLKNSITTLQESLDYLRICIKYQLLDIEATRRENDYLKKLLEDKGV